MTHSPRAAFARDLECGRAAAAFSGGWHHSPAHRLEQAGAYMVTAGTYRKELRFSTPQRRDLLQSKLLELAGRYGWKLQAWAVLGNHYHFIAVHESKPQSLQLLIKTLHAQTAASLNKEDNTPGRRVWFQYWDSHITYPRSYFARLNYVHHNPVRHGVVACATDYTWSSAAWFERNVRPAFHRMVGGFRFDRIDIPDDF